MASFTSPHSSPYARLVANVTELGDCWLGTERTSGRGGYIQVNARVPGLGGRVVHFSAHILTWVAHETGATSWDDLFLAYHEFRCSGFEIGHECHMPECRRPSHLTPMTHKENIAQRDARRSPRGAAADPEDLEF
jgi:hypothetical protein